MTHLAWSQFGNSICSLYDRSPPFDATCQSGVCALHKIILYTVDGGLFWFHHTGETKIRWYTGNMTLVLWLLHTDLNAWEVFQLGPLWRHHRPTIRHKHAIFLKLPYTIPNNPCRNNDSRWGIRFFPHYLKTMTHGCSQK